MEVRLCLKAGSKDCAFLDNDLLFLDSHLCDLCLEIEIRASRGAVS
jgi:hypothetical protein